MCATSLYILDIFTRIISLFRGVKYIINIYLFEEGVLGGFVSEKGVR